MRIEELDGRDVYLIHDFLSAAECDEFIDRAEAAGFGDAPITTAAGPVMMKHVRNNERVMIDDVALAAGLWGRAEGLVPDPLHGRRAVGLNERFRFYRYDIGQQFRLHSDGPFERSRAERSLLTFMVYLNDGFDGGGTAFYTRDSRLRFTVEPRRGSALVFLHPCCTRAGPSPAAASTSRGPT